MLTPEEIEGWERDLTVADAIVERAQHNADPVRLIRACEVVPMVRAFAHMRALVEALANDAKAS